MVLPMAMTRLTDFVTDLMKSEMKSGASITSKESAHHFMNRVLQEMCIKNPELKKYGYKFKVFIK